MSSEISVKNLEIADDTELRKQEVKIGGIWIPTPMRVINPEKLYSKMNFPKYKTTTEIYKKVTPQKLSSFFDTQSKSTKLSSSITNLSVRAGEDNPCFVIFEYDTINFPSKEESDSLCRLSHSLSDIAPIPSVPKCVRGDKITNDNFDKFLSYLKNCISTLKEINKKQIFGYIPPIAPVFIGRLIDFYLDNGINAYYFDLDGTVVTSHIIHIDTIKRKLKERDYFENHLLHYVNAKFGTTAINNTNTIPAQDIVGFVRGLDSFGGIHVGSRRSKEYYEWLKQQKNVVENSVRLFDKKGYGYHKMFISDKKEIQKFFPEDSVITINNIDFDKKSALQRNLGIINMEQQLMESKNLGIKVHEEPEKTAEYFNNKQFLSKPLLRKILKKS